jgi:hypothetical protein
LFCYDSVTRELLYNILVQFGVPTELFRLTKIYLNESYRKASICRHLSDNFHIQNVLKIGNVLPPLLVTFVFEYVISKFQGNPI